MKLHATIFFLLLSTVITAQTQVTYGVKGGVNYSGFHKQSSANTSEFGFHLGGIAEYAVTERLSVQGELLYSRKGGAIGLSSAISKLGYIEVPVLCAMSEKSLKL